MRNEFFKAVVNGYDQRGDADHRSQHQQRRMMSKISYDRMQEEIDEFKNDQQGKNAQEFYERLISNDRVAEQ